MTKECNPADVALKSLFLGPQSENAIWLQSAVNDLLVRWFEWRQARFVEDGRAISTNDMSTVAFKEQRIRAKSMLADLASRLEGEVPKYSPRYMGHMFSEIAIPAVLGHLAALLHNPNIISGESAPVSVKIEDEVISDLIRMIGFHESRGTGHFTSGGTLANFEAVIRARARLAKWMAVGAALAQVNQESCEPLKDAAMGWLAHDDKLNALKLKNHDWQAAIDAWNFEKIGYADFRGRLQHVFGVNLGLPMILVPHHRHYCWPKAAAFFGFGDETLKNVRLDAEGRMDGEALRQRLEQAKALNCPVMMIVAVVGTTELGVVDPLHNIHEVCKGDGDHWLHVDGAYGGFFASLNRDVCPEMTLGVESSLRALSKVDSMSIDPHKLGYVPYSAGVYLVGERRNYDLSTISAPYIQYSGQDRGPLTIEGSRPATGAAATWMMSKTLSFTPNGLGRVIARNFQARKHLEELLAKSRLPVRLVRTSETNLICFVVAREGESITAVNHRTAKIYDSMSNQYAHFVVSKTTIDWQRYGALCDRFASSWSAAIDSGEITLIRICLMNPFFTSKETKVFYPANFVLELETIVGND